MKIYQVGVVVLIFISLISWANAQEVKAKNSKSLSLGGRVQFQHLYNDKYSSVDSVTSNGFRMRRVRLQFESEITPFLTTKVQVEVRDNSPRLKDAEGKVSLFDKYYFRFGQFKVPVWREEFIRSSGDLILVERSNAAEFLVVNLLSARHIGAEVGGKPISNVSFAINYSNGSGEGASEIDKQIKQGNKLSADINNGKMITGRIDVSLDKRVEIGLSGVINYLGNQVGSLSNKGKNVAIAPDFGIYLPAGLDIEGGMVLGTLNKYLVKAQDDQNYTLLDLTGRWKKMLGEPLNQWGGLMGFELAAGVSYIDTEANALGEKNSYRFGPALYFAKKTRLQTNLEIVEPAVENEDMFWRVRSQFTVNF